MSARHARREGVGYSRRHVVSVEYCTGHYAQGDASATMHRCIAGHLDRHAD